MTQKNFSSQYGLIVATPNVNSARNIRRFYAPRMHSNYAVEYVDHKPETDAKSFNSPAILD